MMRNTAILLLAVAVLAAPAAASSDSLRVAAAKYKKSKSGSGSNCGIGTPETSLLKAGTTDYAFTAAQASAFINNQAKPKVLNHYTTTFDCVDSREPSSDGFNKHLGTPGGDFAELAGGIVAYCRVAGVKCTADVVKRAFELFMDKVASPARPFYLHQSEGKINKVLNDIKDLGYDRPPSLPVVAPSDLVLREHYIESLVVGDHNGCGHLRLMIDNSDAYGLVTPEEAAVPVNLMKAFYEYWWPTPVGSKQRAKIEFPILQGNLEGDAILIVNEASDKGSCSHKSASIVHAWWGGQAFVYNAAAVEDFRKVKLAEFFKDFAKAEKTSISTSAFGDAVMALQKTQLDATLTYLDTAKDASLIAVTY